MPDPIVEMTAAAKTYGHGDSAVEALRGIDMRFDAGVFHAILGPSGSGKSTLLHVAAGLEPPTSGRVAILGQATKDLDDRQLAALRRRSIGYVFQFFNLVPTLTVIENALLPILLDRRLQNSDRVRLDELLEQMQIGHCRRQLPETLSGGERQRAAIVRAMLPRPRLLLADEPTGSLDSEAGKWITEILRQQSNEHGVCLIVVTHDLQVASRADRIIRLHDGRVVA
jgi:putative ABC transport system ATP-binding protein